MFEEKVGEENKGTKNKREEGKNNKNMAGEFPLITCNTIFHKRVGIWRDIPPLPHLLLLM